MFKYYERCPDEYTCENNFWVVFSISLIIDAFDIIQCTYNYSHIITNALWQVILFIY